MGIFQKHGKYFIDFYADGKRVRECVGKVSRRDAENALKARRGEVVQGRYQLQRKVVSPTFEAFVADFMEYSKSQKSSCSSAADQTRLFHLKPFFGRYRLNQISPFLVEKYIHERRQSISRRGMSPANATINRELSALKRMLNLGAQQTPPLVDRVPKIHMLAENNVRTGFFEHDEFLKFRDALPSYLKGFTTFGYKFGWRVEEIVNLTWSQVDKGQWGVRLEVGTTKNKGGRLIYLDSELKEIFKQLWAQRRASNKLLPYVFPNRRGDGKIKDFRFAWNKAFKESKVEHKLFHDLRRTAVRNMIRAGIPEKVAMRISGHKTRSVFERYNIVDDKDLKLATEQQEKYFESVVGTISGTIVDFSTKKPLGSTQEASI